MGKMKGSLLLSVFLFVLVCTVLLLPSSEAGYIDDGKVDANKHESGYSLIIDKDSYKIYYGYSNDMHYVLVNFTIGMFGFEIDIYISGGPSFSDIQMYEEDIRGDEFGIAVLWTYWNLTEGVLEFKADRPYFGNSFGISFSNPTNSYDVLLEVQPASRYVETDDSDDDSDDDDDEKKKDIEWGLVAWILYAWDNWIIKYGGWVFGISMLFLSIFISWTYQVYINPVVLVQREDKYKKIKLGRFVDEERSTDLPDYWKIRFKSGWRGMRTFHCTENFTEIRQWKFMTVYVLEELIPDYICTTLKIGESEQWNAMVRKSGWFNTLKYVVFRIICRVIFNNTITKYFYMLIDFEESDVKVTEVDLLQSVYMMDDITKVCDVKYDKWIIDEKKGKIIEKVEEFCVPIFREDDIKRDVNYIVDTFEKMNEREITIPISDPKEALVKRKSLNQLRSILELKRRLKNEEYNQLSEEFTTLREQYLEMKRNFNMELQGKIIKIFDQFNVTNEDLEDYTVSLLSVVGAGGNVRDAIDNSISKYFAKRETRNTGDLSVENAKLKAQNEILFLENEKLWKGKRPDEGRIKIMLEDKVGQEPD